MKIYTETNFLIIHLIIDKIMINIPNYTQIKISNYNSIIYYKEIIIVIEIITVTI